MTSWECALRHPLIVALVQVALGLLVAYFLTERWQRWRQRREFQHQAMVKFGELTFRMMDSAAQAAKSFGPERETANGQLMSDYHLLVAMKAELEAVFRDGEILDWHGKVLQSFDTLRGLYLPAHGGVAAEVFAQHANVLLAQRESALIGMRGEMGFLSRRRLNRRLPCEKHLVRYGLGLNFVGTVVVAAAGYFGLGAGYGGPIVWVNKLWPITWWIGWLLIATGFVLQWFGCSPRSRAQLST